jgi:hypothetical protein
VSKPSVQLSLEELIERSGVDARLVDRLVELRILVPDAGGRFGPADVYRVRLIHACEAASAGQTLVTGLVAELARDSDLSFRQIGPVELKGFSERVPVFEALRSP